jgi:hypothetical protein
MFANQAVLKAELCLNDVMHRVWFGVFLSLKVVVAFPVSATLRIIGLNISEHDLCSFRADHMPHRSRPKIGFRPNHQQFFRGTLKLGASNAFVLDEPNHEPHIIPRFKESDQIAELRGEPVKTNLKKDREDLNP